MPPTLSGRSGEPFEVRVELGKVREFAAAIGFDHPAAWQGEYPVSAPTFLTTARFWQTPASDPWTGVGRDYSSILHGEQEYIFHGEPPRAGDVLSAQTRIQDVYERQGQRGGSMTFTVAVTEFRDGAGRLVAEGIGTTITTSRPATEGQT